ncbi:MAG: pantoate--beta-alanine ligase [Candidatus Marinimicrobia bacterium]|nr:pantoate--beta-alanine ligase [Candidatus Neomarinimicrobiota bacterium]
MVKIVKTIVELNQLRDSLFGSIGFVPTMGALHDGHLSLIQESNKSCEHTIVSIFVNPNQFAPNEDFDNYPRTINSDLEKLSSLNIEVIFLPESQELYPESYKNIQFKSDLFHVLEGISRPIFFKGVCEVVARLFNIVKPTHAFFGDKDFQQLRIISEMVRELKYDINIIPCKTIREQNGLAMSSRNEYLTKDERNKAKIVFETLQYGLKLIKSGEKKLGEIYNKLINKLSSEPIITIDYLTIVDYDTLKEFDNRINNRFVIFIAIYIRKTRLIDNIYE